METLIKEQKVKKKIYISLFYINAEDLPFDSEAIDLICLLFMLSGKSSVLGNQPANNIGSDRSG